MANQLELPLLNNFVWVPVNPNQPAKYNTKFAEDWNFEETIYDWQEKTTRYMPVRAGDVYPQQFTANFAPILIEIVDCLGNVWFSANASQVRANKYVPGSFLYQVILDTTALPRGLYKGLLTPGGSLADQWKTNWFYVDAEQPHTVLWEYYNNRFHGDVVFETGIKFAMRLPGFFEEKAPGSIDTLYSDQILNQTQLSSRPYELMTHYIGDGGGVPYSWIVKANWAFSCSNVKIDGKLWAKSDGAKWNPFNQEFSRVQGYSIDMRPGINRASRIINPTIDTTKKITLVSYIEGSVFGSIDNSGGTIVTPIINVE